MLDVKYLVLLRLDKFSSRVLSEKVLINGHYENISDRGLESA